jgi:hypothetical protein
MNPDELPLRDIHLPGPVSWWPPAPGWWLLGAALILICAAGVWWWRRRRRIRSAPETLALGELRRLRAAWVDHRDPLRLAGDLSIWLRRVGMSLSSRPRAARLTGEAWQRFLNELAGGPVFEESARRLITEAPYRAGTDAVSVPEGERLLALCERWIGAVSRQARKQ